MKLMNRKPTSLKRVLRTAVVKTFVTSLLVAAGLLFMATHASSGATIIDDARDGNYGRPNATGSPAQLVEDNDCWTGAAPAGMSGKVPGHVVVTVGAGNAKLGGSKLVGLALAQIFEGQDHDLRVHGFCR